jgi:hypothetical protein
MQGHKHPDTGSRAGVDKVVGLAASVNGSARRSQGIPQGPEPGGGAAMLQTINGTATPRH